MHVGKPIDVEELERLESELPYATVPLVAIDEARAIIISELVIEAPSCVFDADELSLAAAVHNLLFLAHPSVDGWSSSTPNRMKVIATAQHLASRPRSQSRRLTLARHALLHNLFDVQRIDTKISWWTGSATFLGQTPPARLARWSSVRRVQQEESKVGFQELFRGADVAAVIVALVRRSPLSHLLCAGRFGPPLHWEDAVFLLRDASLARALAYESLRGSTAAEVLLRPAAFAADFEQMLERSPKESDLRGVAAFLVHLNALLAMREERMREQSPLLATVLSASSRPRGLNTFLALPAALAEVDPRLAEPPGLANQPALAARWRVHRDQIYDVLGEGVVTGLAKRLSRHLTRALPAAEDITEQATGS